MDQIKIGAFIAECRKERKLTQAQLAERLGISNRAISKWETGRAMPDVGMMPELCSVLQISINELFSAERMDEPSYRQRAEQNLLELHRLEEKSNRRLLRLEWVIGYLSAAAYFVMLFAGVYATDRLPWRVVLIVGGGVLLLSGAVVSLSLERGAGYYECMKCGTRYVPSLRAVVFAMHFGRRRFMRCPDCGRRSWQKKVLTKQEHD